MTEPMPVGEYIFRALNYLRTDGWTVNTTQDYAGRMCAMGALGKVRGDPNHIPRPDEEGYEAYMAAAKALAAQIGHKRYPWGDSGANTALDEICVYNNSRESFEDEIVPWFERAMAKEGIQQS